METSFVPVPMPVFVIVSMLVIVRDLYDLVVVAEPVRIRANSKDNGIQRLRIRKSWRWRTRA